MPMDEVIRAIEAADLENIQDLLQTAVRRYKELYPQWRVVFFTVKSDELDDDEEKITDILKIAYRLGGEQA